MVYLERDVSKDEGGVGTMTLDELIRKIYSDLSFWGKVEFRFWKFIAFFTVTIPIRFQVITHKLFGVDWSR